MGVAVGQVATYDDVGSGEFGKSLGNVVALEGLTASFDQPSDTDGGATGVLNGTIITFNN